MPVLRLWKAYEIEELEVDLGFTLPFGSAEAIQGQAAVLINRANEFDLASSQLTDEVARCRQKAEALKQVESRATEHEGRDIQRAGDEMEWLRYKELMFSACTQVQHGVLPHTPPCGILGTGRPFEDSGSRGNRKGRKLGLPTVPEL